MRPPAYIVATSARTPLGLEAESSAAAVRAGLSALDRHPVMVDRAGDMMPGAVDPEIDPQTVGSERLLALAKPALEEIADNVELSEAAPKELPVFVGLSEIRPGFSQEDAEEVRVGISRFHGRKTRFGAVSTFTEGHASGCRAMSSALKLIEREPASICVVGGIESYFNPPTMEWLDQRRSLANSFSRSGFVPGEGASFLMVAGEDAIRHYRLTPIAGIEAVGCANESKLAESDEPCLGEGLTAAVRAALQDLPSSGASISDIICDINTQRYRGEEWGFVTLRLQEYFKDPTSYLSPADRWGDMGAASIPLFGMLACAAAAKGYSAGSSTLIWASSETGLRGALRLRAFAEGGDG